MPLMLEPQFAQKLTYGDVPVVVPRTVGSNVEVTLESRMRSILSVINTITIATKTLVEESKSSSSKDEVQELHQQLLQEKLLTDQLQTQKNDIMQQLEREKDLVKHSKDEIIRLREKCQVLTQEKNKALKEVQELKGAQKGYKNLHIELGKELDRRYVFDSLASIMKHEDSTDTVSFNFEELEELTTCMISKIQDASEEHDFPLFKVLVTDYLKVWKKSRVATEESEDDDEEKDEEEEEDQHDDKVDNDNDDDDGQGPLGQDHSPAKDQDEDSEGNDSPSTYGS